MSRRNDVLDLGQRETFEIRGIWQRNVLAGNPLQRSIEPVEALFHDDSRDLCADTGKTERVPAHSMFIFIGALPRTDWLGNLVERDDRGFLLTGPDLIRDGQRPKGWILDRDPFLLETNVPGIFAVGDVRHGSVKRVASGVGEGSVAVQFIHQYLSKV